MTTSGRYDEGMAVRREVLGDSYVEQANAKVTDFTRDFQQIVTEFAWGTIWTRKGLDRRSRSLITLTALVARGHHDELKMHLRAARPLGPAKRIPAANDQMFPCRKENCRCRRPSRCHAAD